MIGSEAMVNMKQLANHARLTHTAIGKDPCRVPTCSTCATRAADPTDKTDTERRDPDSLESHKDPLVADTEVRVSEKDGEQQALRAVAEASTWKMWLCMKVRSARR